MDVVINNFIMGNSIVDSVDNIDKYILESVDMCEGETILTFSQIQFVKKNGFYDLTSIVKGRSGKPYVKFDDQVYVILENSHGSPMRLKSLEDGIEAAVLAAKFHNAGEGFIQPSGIKVRALWSKKMETYRIFTIKLEKYIDYINSKSNLNDFEKLTKEYVDNLLFRCKKCMKVFKSDIYINALEKSMRKREMCINDISSNTFKIIDEKLVISKVFSIGYNMVEEDVADIIKRVIKEEEDDRVFEKIIDKYNHIRKLEENADIIIKSLVSYPLDSVKIILKYFDDDNYEMKYSDDLIKKFNKSFNNDSKTYILEV